MATTTEFQGAAPSASAFVRMKQEVSDLTLQFCTNSEEHDELVAQAWALAEGCREEAELAREHNPEEALRLVALADEVDWLLDSDGRQGLETDD